jgi:hypothetical protein
MRRPVFPACRAIGMRWGTNSRRKAPGSIARRAVFAERATKRRALFQEGATANGSWPVQWGGSLQGPLRRIGDSRVFGAHRAGALSPRTGEILDSRILGRHRSGSHQSETCRSQSRNVTVGHSFDVAHGFGHTRCWKCGSEKRTRQRDLGCPDITSEEPKLSSGCAHAACRRCRNRSKASCMCDLRLSRRKFHADPKRETAPGEATSDVGSWWQSHEIDVDRRSSLNRESSGSIDERRVGSRNATFFTEWRRETILARPESVRPRKTCRRRRRGDRDVRSGLEKMTATGPPSRKSSHSRNNTPREDGSSRGSAWSVVKRPMHRVFAGNLARETK